MKSSRKLNLDGRMLVSREKNRYAPIDTTKVGFGQFHTVGRRWLFPHIRRFICDAMPATVVDPFAGDGHLLDAVAGLDTPADQFVGMDIFPTQPDFVQNDSLERIPVFDRSLIVTNPPYLAKHSAKRKRVYDAVKQYYSQTGYSDLYLIALDLCLAAATHVVAIIPETFLGTGFDETRLEHATIVEGDLFTDTDTPVCVACFGPPVAPTQTMPSELYVNELSVGRLADLRLQFPRPRMHIPIRFNDPHGQLALRAVDGHDPDARVSFKLREEAAYHHSRIKHSSRLMTYVSVPEPLQDHLRPLVNHANEILQNFLIAPESNLLSPFKGNNRAGRRRRRLDYATARSILERAIERLSANSTTQGHLF